MKVQNKELTDAIARVRALSAGAIESDEVVLWPDDDKLGISCSSQTARVVSSLIVKDRETFEERYISLPITKMLESLRAAESDGEIEIVARTRTVKVKSSKRQFEWPCMEIHEQQHVLVKDVDPTEKNMVCMGSLKKEQLEIICNLLQGTQSSAKANEYKIVMSTRDGKLYVIVNCVHVIGTLIITEPSLTVDTQLSTISQSIPAAIIKFAKLESGPLVIWVNDKLMRIVGENEKVVTSYAPCKAQHGKEMIDNIHSLLKAKEAKLSIPSEELNKLSTQASIAVGGDGTMHLIADKNKLSIVASSPYGSFASTIEKAAGYSMDSARDKCAIATTPTIMRRILSAHKNIAVNSSNIKKSIVDMEIYSLSEDYSFCTVSMSDSKLGAEAQFIFKFRTNKKVVADENI